MTAHRWESVLRDLGWDVVVEDELSGPCDALVALHARRSADSIERYAGRGPLLVALTGTDLYRDLAGGDPRAAASVDAATRLIVLQPLAIEALEPRHRDKARVVYQSTVPPDPLPAKASPFVVCVAGHLRPVKDPFRTAEAARDLPAGSPVRVVHIGSAPDAETEDRARRESRDNPRYQWLGPTSRRDALVEIARSQLLCLTSVMEGGANVVTEALACDTPVVSSRIAGSVGLLGDDYPGYFSPGDTAGLTAVLDEASSQGDLYADLVARCRARKHIADRATEVSAWRDLLAELSFS